MYTLIVYNTARAITENKKLKALSFVKQKLLILVALIATSLVLNIAAVNILYGSDKYYAAILKYSIMSTYLPGSSIGIVYAVINYPGSATAKKIRRKRT